MMATWIPLKQQPVCPCGARRLVDQPSRQRPLGLPQQEAPRQPQPQPGLSFGPELLRLGRSWWNARPLPQCQDQSACPVRSGVRSGAGEPQGPRGAGRPQQRSNAPRVFPPVQPFLRMGAQP